MNHVEDGQYPSLSVVYPYFRVKHWLKGLSMWGWGLATLGLNLWFTGRAVSPDEPLMSVNCIDLYLVLVTFPREESFNLPGRYRQSFQCSQDRLEQSVYVNIRLTFLISIHHPCHWRCLVSLSPENLCCILSGEQTSGLRGWEGHSLVESRKWSRYHF